MFELNASMTKEAPSSAFRQSNTKDPNETSFYNNNVLLMLFSYFSSLFFLCSSSSSTIFSFYSLAQQSAFLEKLFTGRKCLLLVRFWLLALGIYYIIAYTIL